MKTIKITFSQYIVLKAVKSSNDAFKCCHKVTIFRKECIESYDKTEQNFMTYKNYDIDHNIVILKDNLI